MYFNAEHLGLVPAAAGDPYSTPRLTLAHSAE
jgi:hypothetical protein